MPTPLVLFEDTHWLFAQPVQQSPGNPLDFSGDRLSVVFRESLGGAVVATANSDEGSLTFMPGAVPYFLVDIPRDKRTWTTRRATTIFGDIERAPNPGKPADYYALGRIVIDVHPGTGSTSLTLRSTSPALIDAQPYGGVVWAAPLIVGPQGPSGAPTYQGTQSADGQLAINILDGAYVKVTLTEPAALVLTGWPLNLEMGRVTLELDIAPGATITAYPSGTVWSNGTPPVLSDGPALDVLMFTSIDRGGRIFGHIIGQDYHEPL